MSLCWNIAETICIVKRGGHRGIHPGANVGVDLIIWLGLTASTTIFGLFGPVYNPGYEFGYYDYLEWSGRTSSDVYERAASLQRRAIALVSFGSLLL